jgi:acetyl-CoA C-acetyltransferase
MKEVVIVGAVRTPIGSFRGAFSALSAVDLGAASCAPAGTLLAARQVDELIFGQV